MYVCTISLSVCMYVQRNSTNVQRNGTHVLFLCTYVYTVFHIKIPFLCTNKQNDTYVVTEKDQRDLPYSGAPRELRGPGA